MASLNEPVGLTEREPADEWTAEKGIVRAAIHGSVAALIAATVLAPIAMFLPYLLLASLTRIGRVLAVAWVFMKVVQRAAGMSGPACIALALGLTLAVMLSQHAVFALYGVPALAGIFEDFWMFPAMLVETIIPEQNGWMRGWRWFHPYVLLVVNAIPLLIGAAVCAWTAARG